MQQGWVQAEEPAIGVIDGGIGKAVDDHDLLIKAGPEAEVVARFNQILIQAKDGRYASRAILMSRLSQHSIQSL